MKPKGHAQKGELQERNHVRLAILTAHGRIHDKDGNNQAVRPAKGMSIGWNTDLVLHKGDVISLGIPGGMLLVRLFVPGSLRHKQCGKPISSASAYGRQHIAISHRRVEADDAVI